MADVLELLSPPTEHMKVPILKDLREDEGRLEHNLKLLETWVSCQNHLPKNYEKQLLISFLRGCKHDMQRAKKKLEQYFISKTFEEGLFRNRVMTMEQDLLLTTFGYVLPLPEITPEGYRIILRTIVSKDDTVYNVFRWVRYEMMIYEFRLHHETLSAGDIYVHDLRNMNAGHAAKTLCMDLWKVVDFIQNACPLRLKQVHIISEYSVVVRMVELIKQIFSAKLAKRFYLHPNWESVYKMIPKRLFPSDLGGEKKTALEMIEQWNKKLVESEGWFQKLDEVKVSGPKPKEFEFSDVYGVEGSFRKINVD